MKQNNGTPLQGKLVIELGSLIAGPMATRILADFGAEVIKIEHPEKPDPMRKWGRVLDRERSLWWAVQSRGKNLLSLDLKQDSELEKLKSLIQKADVLVENFRPGTLEKLGLSPENLWKTNPKLVIARVSGYGQTGPKSSQPGYASVAEAESGLRFLNGYPNQPPPRTGISLGDSLASLYAVQGILMALYWRDAQGGNKGQVVDISLVESCFSMLEGSIAEYGHAGIIGKPGGTRLDGIAPSNIYKTKDDIWIVIAANQDSVFSRLCDAMGQAELKHNPKYIDHIARGKNQDELDNLISAWVIKLSSTELEEILNCFAVPLGRVNNIKDVFESEQFNDREMIVPIEDGEGLIYQPGITPKLSLTPGKIKWNGSAKIGKTIL